MGTRAEGTTEFTMVAFDLRDKEHRAQVSLLPFFFDISVIVDDDVCFGVCCWDV